MALQADTAYLEPRVLGGRFPDFPPFLALRLYDEYILTVIVDRARLMFRIRVPARSLPADICIGIDWNQKGVHHDLLQNGHVLEDQCRIVNDQGIHCQSQRQIFWTQHAIQFPILFEVQIGGM